MLKLRTVTHLVVEIKKKYHLIVKGNTVYKILQIADPEGISNRFGNKLQRRQYLNPGPNFIWYLDGYDKLKQFGFAIYGCVTSFSRMILWLDVATTNKDPKVTAYYYLNTVKNLKFVPTIIRTDKDSENTMIESLQICLRQKHTDKLVGQKSFIQGENTRNQRIESYWGQMRRHSADFYIQFFKCMKKRNLFNGRNFHIKCLQYCFGPLIRSDLYSTKELWNEYRIRKQAAQNNICGRPYIMFNLPEKFNIRNYKRDVNEIIIQRLIGRFTTKLMLIDPLFHELVEQILVNVTVPMTTDEALIFI